MWRSHPLNGWVGGGGEEANAEIEHVDAKPVGDDVPPADIIHAADWTGQNGEVTVIPCEWTSFSESGLSCDCDKYFNQKTN